jgi:hypothetical protein
LAKGLFIGFSQGGWPSTPIGRKKFKIYTKATSNLNFFALAKGLFIGDPFKKQGGAHAP